MHHIFEIVFINLGIRVEAQSKMNMMKEKTVKDLLQYNTEMKELERVISHGYNLKAFMTTKCERTGQGVDQENGQKQCRTFFTISIC